MRFRSLKLLTGLPLLSASALFALVALGGGGVALGGLAVVGFAYGAIIAVFPATLAKMFGTTKGARVYGRVFTAWGTAGLFAPWLAGTLYDRTGGYSAALVVALCLCAVSALAARRMSSLPEA